MVCIFCKYNDTCRDDLVGRPATNHPDERPLKKGQAISLSLLIYGNVLIKTSANTPAPETVTIHR